MPTGVIKIVLFLTISLTVLIFGIALLLPSRHRFQRKIYIEAPLKKVFHYISDSRTHERWDPFSRYDMVAVRRNVHVPIEYSIKTEDNEILILKWRLMDRGNSVRVVWTVETETMGNPLQRFIPIFTGLDNKNKMETGLKRLKYLLESP